MTQIANSHSPDDTIASAPQSCAAFTPYGSGTPPTNELIHANGKLKTTRLPGCGDQSRHGMEPSSGDAWFELFHACHEGKRLELQILVADECYSGSAGGLVTLKRNIIAPVGAKNLRALVAPSVENCLQVGCQCAVLATRRAWRYRLAARTYPPTPLGYNLTITSSRTPARPLGP